MSQNFGTRHCSLQRTGLLSIESRQRQIQLTMSQENYILAINPWICDFTAFDLWFKPYGLLCTAGFLKKNGYNVRLLDCLDRKHYLLKGYNGKKPDTKQDGRGKFITEPITKPKELKGVIRRYKRYGIPLNLVESELGRMERPAAVLITSQITFWYPGVKEMATLVRKIFPGVPVALGGIYPSLHKAKAEEEIHPDFICVNDDLYGLLRFLDKISGKENTYPSGFPVFEEWNDPDYSLLQDKTALPVITSVGCPYSCPFCITSKRWGKYRFIDPSVIAERILGMNSQHGVKNFAFYDDALLHMKKENLFKIFERIIDAKADLNFHAPNGLFPRDIDIETSMYFKEAGVKTIRLSFESSSPMLQKKMNKVTDSELISALKNLESAGYKRPDIEIYLIAGLPEQTLEDIVQSMDFINSQGGRIHLAYYSPIPGTPSGEETISKYFPPDYDPVMTNKFAFTQWHPKIGWEEFETLREIKRKLNNSL